jgi:hypothetical protein
MTRYLPRRDFEFRFRMGLDERRTLTRLAELLQRNQSDALRWLIRNAAAELATQSETSPPTPAHPSEPEAAHA